MLLAELKPDGSVRILEDVQKPLTLGRETLRTGTLSAASIQKAVNILRQYRAMMDSYGVTHTRAVGHADRKSTRLNSSHVRISYAVFCFKKKKISARGLYHRDPQHHQVGPAGSGLRLHL